MFYGFFCFLAYLRMPSLPLVKDVKEQKATFPYRKLFTPDLNVFSFMQKLLFYPSLLHTVHQKGRLTSLNAEAKLVPFSSVSSILVQYLLNYWHYILYSQRYCVIL